MSRYTAFRCPEDVLRRAKRVADSERRSLSNYIIRLLEEDLIERAVRDREYEKQKSTQHLHGSSHPA
jgi:hypothetical protein